MLDIAELAAKTETRAATAAGSLIISHSLFPGVKARSYAVDHHVNALPKVRKNCGRSTLHKAFGTPIPCSFSRLIRSISCHLSAKHLKTKQLF
ncbi:MAG: hypothetical protein AAFX00_11900, partial [Pseudomonadota bacterium]